MKSRSIMTFGLLAVLLLVGCAPAESPALVEHEAPAQPAAPVTEPQVEPTPLPTETLSSVAATEVLPTEAPSEVPQPVATSRGPDLEATDPATVSLASGDVQLVEFFRFT